MERSDNFSVVLVPLETGFGYIAEEVQIDALSMYVEADVRRAALSLHSGSVADRVRATIA
jgi:hypothetical protein